jgi:hypothetical protein
MNVHQREPNSHEYEELYEDPVLRERGALVLIDQQSGVMQLVHDYSPAELRNNVIGLAKLGKVFNLPTVLTTSSDQGPNGPIIPELLSMFHGAPLIRRTTGTISA